MSRICFVKTCLLLPFQLLRVISSGKMKAWTISWLIQMLTDQNLCVFLLRGEHLSQDLFPLGLWVKLGKQHPSGHCSSMVRGFPWNHCFEKPWNLNFTSFSHVLTQLGICNLPLTQKTQQKQSWGGRNKVPCPPASPQAAGRSALHGQCWLPPDLIYFYPLSRCSASRI